MRSRYLSDAIQRPPAATLVIAELMVGGLLCVLLLTGLAHLTHDVLEQDVNRIDDEISRAVYAYRTPARTVLMRIASELGGGNLLPVASAGIVAISWRRRHRRVALIFAATMAISFLLHLALKTFVDRPRPMIDPLIQPGGYSFPSGHSMNSLVFYAFLAYLAWRYLRRKWLAFGVTIAVVPLVCMVGFSRVYLGVHYPSDVAAGFIAGLFWVGCLLLAERTVSFRQMLVEHAARSVPDAGGVNGTTVEGEAASGRR